MIAYCRIGAALLPTWFGAHTCWAPDARNYDGSLDRVGQCGARARGPGRGARRGPVRPPMSARGPSLPSPAAARHRVPARSPSLTSCSRCWSSPRSRPRRPPGWRHRGSSSRSTQCQSSALRHGGACRAPAAGPGGAVLLRPGLRRADHARLRPRPARGSQLGPPAEQVLAVPDDLPERFAGLTSPGLPPHAGMSAMLGRIKRQITALQAV
ncbi:hypothetical protein QJS66_04695 [Kocuria rhizophila]|nr:hypothetical protein QJS66_04695 [Kocuria rhizophila]